MYLKRRRLVKRIDFAQYFIQVGLYSALVIMGYLLGSVLQHSDNAESISIYNRIEIDKGLTRTEFPESVGIKNIKVLCYVVTSPDFLWTRAVHVRETWGKRCDKTLYFSSKSNASFPAIGLNVSEGRQHLTAKSHLAFRYIYKHYFDTFDWFLKADDNTYVIVENLKYFLSSKDTNAPTFFGHHFMSIIEGGYASGGAGYVLSKQALKRLAIDGTDDVICRQDGGAEDVEIGKCLHNLGVTIGDSYDFYGKSVFHCFDPASHLLGNYPSWYLKFDAAGAHKGKKHMSKDAVSFHYVKPEAMYVYDYFLYHVKVH